MLCRYREACRDVVLSDLGGFDTYNILTGQWETHTRVRARFVQALSKVGILHIVSELQLDAPEMPLAIIPTH
jgi:hypothetical protein